MTALELMLAITLVGSLGLSIWLWGKLRRNSALRPVSVGPAAPTQPSSAVQEATSFAQPPAAILDTTAQPLFAAAAAILDVGLVVVDAYRIVYFINSHAAQLLNNQAERSVGDALIALLRDHQADALVGEVLRDGEPREITMTPFVSGRTLRMRASRLQHDDTEAGVLLVIRDMTQISMLERSRRDLVANVSHELRTPLASLKLLVETVQSEPPPEVSKRMLGQMSQEIDAVTQLVDELHELSQIESGRVTLKLAPTAIDGVVARALERIKPQADRKQIQIAAHSDPSAPLALIDADRIGQVLLNLLHNAVKFTAAGGTVEVQTRLISGDHPEPSERTLPSDHPAGIWICVRISDTGIGIPNQELRRIFERFYKVDRARTRNAGGTGLGLAIAKHLIEGHGGRLWADSIEGRGSTFSFTLPTA